MQRTNGLRVLFLVLMVMSYISVVGQQSLEQAIDTIVLRDAPVALRSDQSRQLTEVVGSINAARNIDQVIAQNGLGFVKSYGSGSLATVSLRGGTANQTAIFWEGVPITSPTLGLSDLSLLPSFLMSSVEFSKSDQAAKYGSGAISGMLDIKTNNSDHSNGLTAELSSASFGNRTIGLSAQYGLGSLDLTTKLFAAQGKNDFEYQVANSTNNQRLIHNETRQYALLQTITWNIAERQKLEASLWWHDTDRQIPPTTTQNQSLAEQFDHGVRTLLKWHISENHYDITAKTSYLREVNDYSNPLILLEASNSFYRSFSEVIYTNKRQSVLSRIGLSYDHIAAQSTSIDGTALRNKLDVFGRLTRMAKGVSLDLDWRQIVVDGDFVLPVASLSASKYWRKAKLKLNLARNYRLPALNDVYWVPGGNLDLQPEYGWSQELSISTDLYPSLELSASVYSKLLNNWILWSKTDAFVFWSASNLSQVWSRGVELTLAQDHMLDDWRIRNIFHFSYVRSTVQDDIALPKFDKGQQLSYVPILQISHNLELDLHGYSFGLMNNYVGASDGSLERLDSYFLTDISIDKSYQWHDTAVTLALSANNIWDTQYRVIERRPMPGRNYEIKFRIEI